MNTLLKHRILLSFTERCLLCKPKNLKFIDWKNNRASYSNRNSLCPPPTNNPPSPCPLPKEPPPCPPPPPPCGPPCPPPNCRDIPDPHDPCNYVKPEDPDELDMTKLKRMQCFYQQESDTPIYLRGRKNRIFFQAVTILGGITFIQTVYAIYELINFY